MKIVGFQKCKIHSFSLKGLKITACQSWCKSAETRIRTQVCSVSAYLHQIWEAVIPKPFKLDQYILHFLKGQKSVNAVYEEPHAVKTIAFVLHWTFIGAFLRDVIDIFHFLKA